MRRNVLTASKNQKTAAPPKKGRGYGSNRSSIATVESL